MGVLPIAVMVLLFGVLIAGCSGDGDDAGDDGDGAEATEPADGDTGDATEPADDGDGDGDGGGDDGSGSGSATLSIGDESWSFSDVYCAFTQEETRSERVSFYLSGSGETAEGVRIELNASIEDEQNDGRYKGDGVTYKVSVVDVADFENPAVRWLSLLFPMEDSSLLQVEGKNVSADMTFRDYVTGAVDEILGTLEGTCP